jgi:hypothetical protein
MSDQVAILGEEEALGLYFELPPTDLIDLEVAAAAAIEWSRGLKAAAKALDPSHEYRVTLISATPGSSKWRAKVEQYNQALQDSKINKQAERVAAGWKGLPLVARVAIALAVVIPTTAKPTIEYWLDTEDFSETQLEQIRGEFDKAIKDQAVKAHRQTLFQEVQRDRKITGVGSALAPTKEWAPKKTVPADQFAEGRASSIYRKRRRGSERFRKNSMSSS